MLCVTEFVLSQIYLPIFFDKEWENVNIVSGAPKMFLRELLDPLIPYSFYKKFIDVGSEFYALLELLQLFWLFNDWLVLYFLQNKFHLRR